MKLEWNGHYWTLELGYAGQECTVWADRVYLTPRGKKKAEVWLWQEDWLVGQVFLGQAEGSLGVRYDETEHLLQVEFPSARINLYQVELGTQEPKPGFYEILGIQEPKPRYYEIKVKHRFTGAAVALVSTKAEHFKKVGALAAETPPPES